MNTSKEVTYFPKCLPLPSGGKWVVSSNHARRVTLRDLERRLRRAQAARKTPQNSRQWTANHGKCHQSIPFIPILISIYVYKTLVVVICCLLMGFCGGKASEVEEEEVRSFSRTPRPPIPAALQTRPAPPPAQPSGTIASIGLCHWIPAADRSCRTGSPLTYLWLGSTCSSLVQLLVLRSGARVAVAGGELWCLVLRDCLHVAPSVTERERESERAEPEGDTKLTHTPGPCTEARYLLTLSSSSPGPLGPLCHVATCLRQPFTTPVLIIESWSYQLLTIKRER